MLDDIRLIEDHYCPQYSVNGNIVEAWNRIKTALGEAQKQSAAPTNNERVESDHRTCSICLNGPVTCVLAGNGCFEPAPPPIS